MFNLITIVLGLASLLIVTVAGPLTNAGGVLPNVPVIATVYASVHRDAHGALLTALIVGGAATTTLSGARGIWLLSLLAVVGLTRIARFRLPLQRVLPAAAWTVAACAVADIAFATLGAVLVADASLWGTLLRVTPAAALVTGLGAIPFFMLLGLVEPSLRARQERTLLLHKR